MLRFGSKFLSILPQQFTTNIQKRCFFWRQKKKELPYVIVRPTQDEYCKILDLMWTDYYPEEPTTVALGLGHKYNPAFDDHALKALSEGLSLIAKCKYNGDIVGACINKTACPWDPDLTDRLACGLSCEQTRQLFHFYAFVQRAPCLWDKYCTNKIFEISQLVVRRSDRGKGLGSLLTEASRKLGADTAYRVIRVDCTSQFTSMICEKQKLHLSHEIPYCSYTGKGEAQEPIIKAAPPHSSCKIFVDTPFRETK